MLLFDQRKCLLLFLSCFCGSLLLVNRGDLSLTQNTRLNKYGTNVRQVDLASLSGYSNTGQITSPRSAGQFLLSLTISDQLSAATSIMYTLAPLASDWGAQMVEPFLTKSFIFGIQNVHPPALLGVERSQMIRLFNVYNSTELNQVFRTKVSTNVSMVDYETFYGSASRDITIFHFSSKAENQRTFSLNAANELKVKRIFKKETFATVLDCLSLKLKSLKYLIKTITRGLNRNSKELSKQTSAQRKPFRVKQVFCLDPSKVYSSDELRKHIPPQASIIFTNWRGCGLANCSMFANHNLDLVKVPEHSNANRYVVLTRTPFQSIAFETEKYKLHHDSIEATANTYLKMLGYKNDFVSIHIRSERLFRYGHKIGDLLYYNSCLKELSVLLEDLNMHPMELRQSYENNVLAITDVTSKYGTGSCKEHYCTNSTIASFHRSLERFHIHPQGYDPKAMNSTENNGYVSLVEMHMLALGEKLVLVGFGGFQNILEELFLSHSGNSKKSVYHVCRP